MTALHAPTPPPGRNLELTAGIGLAGALLGGLSVTVGLGPAGWVAGGGVAAATALLLGRGLAASGAPSLGPANAVTYARSLVVAAVTALAAVGSTTPALVVLAVLALALDGVDGMVARRTSSASALGARFDMEVDAFLILVLSLHVGRTLGVWVIAIGAARYAFVASGWLLPWMRARLPFRYWRKVVAASQGVVLTLAAAMVLPTAVAVLALLIALALVWVELAVGVFGTPFAGS